MKKTSIIFSVLAATLIAASCAKTASTELNSGTKQSLEAWINTYHPDAPQTPEGVWILADEPGTGAELEGTDEELFVYLDYTTSTPASLGESFVSTTFRSLAERVGTGYDKSYYYGPKLTSFSESGISAGLESALKGMKVGGHRKCLVPGWLNTTSRYDKLDDYYANESGTSTIYDLYLRDIVPDETKWELDSLSAYFSHNFPKVKIADSLIYGVYLIDAAGNAVKTPYSESVYPGDTTVYVNYSGRLLNGSEFDSSSKMSVQWGKDYSLVTITTSKSKPVAGFAAGVWNMPPRQEVSVIFISSLGYGSSGSGKTIPAYSPLRFDLEATESN